MATIVAIGTVAEERVLRLPRRSAPVTSGQATSDDRRPVP